jgi:hypothetical protein
MKNKPRYIVFLGILFFSAGCAHIQEGCKEIWGSSIKHLESARSSGASAEIALPLESAFKNTEVILISEKADVYLKDKDMNYMAAMNFKGHVNTTQVGIFFTSLSANTTKVEVASMSPQLVDQVAGFLFPGLKEGLGQKSATVKGEER